MTLYISNLDQAVTNETLAQLFAQHGEVKAAKIALDVFTGKPRGFANVEMPNEAEAERAIAELHNYALNDRTITVQLAQPKVEHKGSYPVGNGFQNPTFMRSYGSQKKKRFGKR